MTRARYDLVVVGGGSAGLTAAELAARLGARVALVEADRLGGDCTWTGCIPSKSLLRAARVAHDAREAHRFGVTVGGFGIDVPAVGERVRDVVQRVHARESPEVLAGLGVDVVSARAEFVDPHTLQAGSRRLSASKVLIATGAQPVVPQVGGLTDVAYLTSRTVFDLDRLPRHLVVLGAGPIGLELAQAFQRLGSEVTVVADQILPHDDPDASHVVRQVLAGEGVAFVTSLVSTVRPEIDATRTGPPGIVVMAGEHDVHGDQLLVAAGRRPQVDGLALDRAGVRYGPDGIPVDDRFRTSVRHIYAAGDVVRHGPQFTHMAAAQAFQAARNALLPGSWSGAPTPLTWVTFTDPELAQVGPTAAEAAARYRGIRTVHWPMARVDRALTAGHPEGFLKLIADRRGRLVGATIVAPRAGELAGELSLAVAARLPLGTLARAVHPYPTYATAIQQAASAYTADAWLGSRAGRLVRRLRGYRITPHHDGGGDGT